MPEQSHPWWHDHWREEAAKLGYLFRVAEDPIIALRALSDFKRLCDELMRECVRDCRRDGKTWAQIGESLRVSRQAAQRRFSD